MDVNEKIRLGKIYKEAKTIHESDAKTECIKLYEDSLKNSSKKKVK